MGIFPIQMICANKGRAAMQPRDCSLLVSEPRWVCQRLQLLSRMEHHQQDNEQVFPQSAPKRRAFNFGHPGPACIALADGPVDFVEDWLRATDPERLGQDR